MCVHSHADSQKSSGAFFHDIGIGKCRKQSSRRRNALRASEGVRPTDVMVNTTALAAFHRMDASIHGENMPVHLDYGSP